MSHVKTISTQQPWGLFNVSLLEVGTSGDDNRKRRFSCSYAPFKSVEDAQSGESPQTPHCHLKCEGSVVDEFFWDATAGEYVAARSKILPYLVWYLSGNPTEAQLERCPEMAQNRENMAGLVMFPSTPFEFTVTELPEERASE